MRFRLAGKVAKQLVLIFVSVLLPSIVATAEDRPVGNSAQVVSARDSSLTVRLAILRSRADATPLVVIDKSDRKLSFFRSGILDTTFSAEFGRGRTDGDKVKEGDWRTPEGEFQVCYRNSRSRFYKALLLDYPLPEDAERGLRDGIIESSDYRRIMASHEAGEIPDQYTGLGGLIEIHGRGGVGFDWTRGCVAINNSGIDYLFDHTRIGTKVVISE